MGVSSGSDLSFLVEGGEQFVQRLAEFQKAKAEFTAELEAMNLGKSAREAFDEAGRVLAEAKEKRDAEMNALAKDVATARATLQAWSDQMTQEANRALEAAQGKMAEAGAQLASASALREQAATALRDAQDQAGVIVADAKARAAAFVADATEAATAARLDADRIRADAEIAMNEAEAIKARYSDAMAKIQSAIVTTG